MGPSSSTPLHPTYFCPVHRVYHCFVFLSYTVQPYCGECAVHFFHTDRDVIWMCHHDRQSTTENSAQVLRRSVRELLTEAAPNNGRNSFSEYSRVTENITDEIPKDDITYTEMGSEPLPHPLRPGVGLFSYRTFAGGEAYQPCQSDIHAWGLSQALQVPDQVNDPAFVTARAWSCVIQAAPNLPREVRWVLATIYDFSSLVLRRGGSHQRLRPMRLWLRFWFIVVKRLFRHFGLNAACPYIDWIPRPSQGANGTGDTNTGQMDGRRRRFPSESSSGTVIRHQPSTSETQELGVLHQPNRSETIAIIQQMLREHSTSSGFGNGGAVIFEQNPTDSDPTRAPDPATRL
ncbi:hypothetical protein S40293_04556 [Stachybotrys chartarum IBT 40293]|nr:hypothetical protein S40293_04556 [Stachybotrys chartarum IBT 40293]KFA77581.1 hypothetical protein S40288_05762 [Stachybotrys chartarum IBT 40288]